MKKLLVGLLATLMLAGCSTANQQGASNHDAIQVAATIFPVADIATQIGGDKVEVTSLLPAGASPHTYDFSPSDVRKINSTQIAFSIGHDLDGWIEELAENVSEDIEIVTVDSGIELTEFEEHDHSEHAHEGEEHEGHVEEGHDDHDHDEHKEESHDDHDHDEHEHHEDHDHDEHDHEEEGHDDHDDHHGHNHDGIDPHYWLDAENGMIIAENIANKLIEIDPENSDYYLTNLESFKTEMMEINSEISQLIAEQVESPEMIVFHDSWYYFARAYNLEVVATFEPSPGKEPSPQYLENLYEEAEFHNLTSVFSEPQLSSDSLDPFVEDLGLEIFVLDPLGGLEETGSYQDLLLYNARTIAEAI